ncbi:fused toxin protein [Crotalus tigris]|uniref:fused toxin protein n=1 Tax=Crotalus tigris TaxID=88082 RepID=UPI00192F4825|nr:fused toxin protein [Crotalus tigris]
MSSGGLLLLLGVLALWAELTPVSGQDPPKFCSLPAETGQCRGRIPRFYYNSASQQCEQFFYSGCAGNANNFETKDQCQYTCVEKPGVCPQGPQQQGQQGKIPCRKNCENDWKCPGQQKCCRYGGMTECKDAVFETFASPTRTPTPIGSTPIGSTPIGSSVPS